MTVNTLVTSGSATDFIDRIGVAAHSGPYVTGIYSSAQRVIGALAYTGISNVRNAFFADAANVAFYKTLALAGTKFDFLAPSELAQTGANGIAAFVAGLNGLAIIAPGAIWSIEGANEVNIQALTFNGDSSLAGASAFQQALYQAIKSAGALSGIAVTNVSVAYDDTAAYRALLGTSGYFDFSSIHAYNSSQSGILDNMLPSIVAASTLGTNKPFIITESGYTTDPAFGALGVDEVTQAKLTIDTLLDGFAAGSQKTFLYELFDNYQDAQKPEQEHHWGLFRADGSAKPAATALHNLTALLSSGGGAAMNGTFQVADVGTDGHSLSLAKASGATDLMLWRDTALWDDATHAAKAVSPQLVTISFTAVQPHVYVYSPVDGLGPIATYSNVLTIAVPLSDSPLVIELGTDLSASTGPVAGSATVTMDAATFVAKLAVLQQTSGISHVELTDGHLLQMSSVASMQDIVASYGDVLAKVTGGFQFEIASSGAGWKISSLYDQGGQLESTTTMAFNGSGATTAMSVVKPDQSGEWDDYGVTGQSYTRDRYVYGAGRVLQSVTRYHADSTLDGTIVYNPDGSRAVTTYDAGGHLTLKVTTAADGGHSTISYDGAGHQTLRQDVSAGSVVTGWIYAASGAATAMSVTNPDQSGEWDNYGVTGQSYTRDRYVYGAGHVLQSVTRYHADDTLDSATTYNADGSVSSVTTAAASATASVAPVADSGRSGATPSAATAAGIDQLYVRYEGRHASADEIGAAAAQLAAGSRSLDTLRTDLLAQADSAAYLTGAIGQIYQIWGGRPATLAETAVWQNEMAIHGATLETVRRAVLADPLGAGYTLGIITQAYQATLGRAPTTAERDAWNDHFMAGLSQPTDVGTLLGVGTPVVGIDALVTQAYETFGGRAPTAGELATWHDTILNGSTLARLQADIVADPLGTDYLNLQTTQAYQQWMGRAATAQELATWHDTFANNGAFSQLKNDLLADDGVVAYQATRLASVFTANGWGTPSATDISTMMTALRSGASFADAAAAAGGQEGFGAAPPATVMTGTGSHDIFVVGNIADQVVEPSPGSGATIYAGVSYILPTNVDQLILTGHANLNGTGNSAANTLIGNDGNNILAGGGGADEITGGLGADTFVLAPGDALSPMQPSVHITDFSHAEADRIDLTALRATHDAPLSFIGVNAFDHHAGQVRMQMVGGDWDVSIDRDGDGVADAHFTVTSRTGALVASDFLL